MKKLSAIIHGVSVSINEVEDAAEYNEGARASGEDLLENEGYLFKYDIPQILSFENTGVPFELKVLYLTEVGVDMWIVMDEALLQKDSAKLASCFTPYEIALELRKDFCDQNGIGVGALLSIPLQVDDEED